MKQKRKVQRKYRNVVHYNNCGSSLCGAKGTTTPWEVDYDIIKSGLSSSLYEVSCKMCKKMIKNRPWITIQETEGNEIEQG